MYTATCAGKDEYLCTSCGAVFQRPNPLKSHIRYHCSARQSTPVTADTSTPWIDANFPLFQSAPLDPWYSSWLRRFPADWNAYPLALATLAARSRGGSHRALTSRADDVTGSTPSPVPNAGWWMDYVQRILHTGNDGTARTVKLRDVTGSTTYDDVTKLGGDVTTNSVGVEEQSTTMTSSRRVAARACKPLGGGGGYACPYCGRSYSRRYGLKIHVRTHTGFKPLQCSVCGRTFGDPSNLNKHVRLHAQSSADGGGGGSEAYRCRHCGKVLVRRRDLDRHLRARHLDQLPPSSDDVSNNGADAILVTSSECVSAGDDNDDVGRLADEPEIAT